LNSLKKNLVENQNYINLLNILIQSKILQLELGNPNTDASFYYYEWNDDTREWDLKKNAVQLEETKTYIKHLFPFNKGYVALKIYNPLNENEVDTYVSFGVLKPTYISIDSSTVINNIFPDGEGVYVDPIAINYTNAPDAPISADNVFNAFLEGQTISVQKVSKYMDIIKDSINKIIMFDRNSQDALKTYFPDLNWKCIYLNRDINKYYQFYDRVVRETLHQGTVCFPTGSEFVKVYAYYPINESEGLYTIYYIPSMHLIYTPISVKDQERSFQREFIYFIIDKFFLLNRKIYQQYFPLTIYGKMNETLIYYIGQEAYETYYTKTLIEKVKLEVVY
jgi:hypothetical protein